MIAKIDIDALKILERSRTNEVENRQKLKAASVNSRFCGLKKKSVLLLVHFWKFLKPNVTVNIIISLPTNNHKDA